MSHTRRRSSDGCSVATESQRTGHNARRFVIENRQACQCADHRIDQLQTRWQLYVSSEECGGFLSHFGTVDCERFVCFCFLSFGDNKNFVCKVL